MVRFNPITALEGSFRGFPFLIARDTRPEKLRGVQHVYPDRDENYFEPLGLDAKSYDLDIYFIGVPEDPTGATADVQAAGFVALLRQKKAGALILPGQVRDQVYARTWTPVKDVDKAGWVTISVNFAAAGKNQLPSSATSWPQTLLASALAARTAFAGALGAALDVADLPLGVDLGLVASAATLAFVLGQAALLAGGDTPSTAQAAGASLTAAYTAALPSASGPAAVSGPLDPAAFSTATGALIAAWADAIANAGDSQTNDDLDRGVAALFSLYGEASSDAWYAAGNQTAVQAAITANQSAFSAALRRLALSEAARLAASMTFASYDDAEALRSQFAAAFLDELNQASPLDGSYEALSDLEANTLLAISAAGADAAKLIPYTTPIPRTAIGLAQLWYPESDVVERALELAIRNGAIHPAFMPTTGQRLSS